LWKPASSTAATLCRRGSRRGSERERVRKKNSREEKKNREQRGKMQDRLRGKRKIKERGDHPEGCHLGVTVKAQRGSPPCEVRLPDVGGCGTRRPRRWTEFPGRHLG